MIDPSRPFDEAMRLLSRRWAADVVRVMLAGETTFGGIVRALPGATERMVSLRLRELAELGLLTRTEPDDGPNRVRYDLTEAGHGLSMALREIERWGRRYGHVLRSPHSRVDDGVRGDTIAALVSIREG
ncbi:MAG: helix-turn-helix domain-containing protein [Kineosporiaceae bacterium]